MKKIVTMLALGLFGLAMLAAPAGAIAVDTGKGAKTVNDPAHAKVGDGLNPAHGPSCGLFPEPCAHNSSPVTPGVFAPGVADRSIAEVNVGAWNAYFLSSENSGICGIWATVEEAEAGFEFAACDFEAE